jgi:hypothetical protein
MRIDLLTWINQAVRRIFEPALAKALASLLNPSNGARVVKFAGTKPE